PPRARLSGTTHHQRDRAYRQSAAGKPIRAVGQRGQRQVCAPVAEHPRRSPPLSTGVRRDGRYATRIAPAAVSHGGGRARIPPGSGGHPEPRRPLHRKDPVSGRGRTAVKELRMRRGEPLHLPSSGRDLLLRSGKRALKLTNLDKLFFPEAGVTKRDLLQYYADVAPALVPHL